MPQKELNKLIPSITFGGEDKPAIFRNRKMIALGIIITLSIPILVNSQNDVLSWGFDADQKIYFKQIEVSITNSTTTFSISFNYYLTTKDNYTIPDPLTYFPLAREEPFFYNDTPVMAGPISFAVPIGNWDLLETLYLSLFSSYYDTITIIDEETHWGFQTTLNQTGTVETQRSIFSKTDGILESSLYEFVFGFGVTHRSVIERIAPPLVIDNLVLVIGGVIIFIGLIAIYFFKRLRGS